MKFKKTGEMTHRYLACFSFSFLFFPFLWYRDRGLNVKWNEEIFGMVWVWFECSPRIHWDWKLGPQACGIGGVCGSLRGEAQWEVLWSFGASPERNCGILLCSAFWFKMWPLALIYSHHSHSHYLPLAIGPLSELGQFRCHTRLHLKNC